MPRRQYSRTQLKRKYQYCTQAFLPLFSRELMLKDIPGRNYFNSDNLHHLFTSRSSTARIRSLIKVGNKCLNTSHSLKTSTTSRALSLRRIILLNLSRNGFNSLIQGIEAFMSVEIQNGKVEQKIIYRKYDHIYKVCCSKRSQ